MRTDALDPRRWPELTAQQVLDATCALLGHEWSYTMGTAMGLGGAWCPHCRRVAVAPTTEAPLSRAQRALRAMSLSAPAQVLSGAISMSQRPLRRFRRGRGC